MLLMNAVVPLFFPDVTISAFPELFAWIQWYYCCVLCFGSIVFYPLLVLSRVTLWVENVSVIIIYCLQQLQHLQTLENLQVELHLLCSCLGVYKLNHLLFIIPPATIRSQLQLFDDYLILCPGLYIRFYFCSHLVSGYFVSLFG